MLSAKFVKRKFLSLIELPDSHVGEGVSGLDGVDRLVAHYVGRAQEFLRDVGEGVSDLHVVRSVKKHLLVIRYAPAAFAVLRLRRPDLRGVLDSGLGGGV